MDEEKGVELLIKAANKGNQFALNTLNRLMQMESFMGEVEVP
jgi:hypothetical protein